MQRRCGENSQAWQKGEKNRQKGADNKRMNKTGDNEKRDRVSERKSLNASLNVMP